MTRFKDLRLQLGLTQEELASKFNDAYGKRYGTSSISMFENGKRIPETQSLIDFADFFNVTTDYLLGRPTMPKQISPLSVHASYKIPVLGKVSAGVPISAIEEILGYEYIEDKYKNDGHEYFALRITGKSMEPTIMDGDIVIVRQQPTADSGQIAIVLIDGQDATAKEIKESQDGITLIGHNVAVYTPHFYSFKQVETMPIQIIGIVIEVRRKLVC